jgi:CheY-like chemotaxis protein
VPTDPDDARTMTVILADADPALRAVLRRALGARVARVIELGAGLDALDAVARERPSLLVLGPGLGEMRAEEIVAAVRGSATWGALPVACAVRDDDGAALARLAESGADAVLALPLVAEARASLRRLVTGAAERGAVGEAPRDLAGLVAAEPDPLARMLASAVRAAVGARCGHELRECDPGMAAEECDARAAVGLVAPRDRRHPVAMVGLASTSDALRTLSAPGDDGSADELLAALASTTAGHLVAALAERGIVLAPRDARAREAEVPGTGEIAVRLAGAGGAQLVARVVVCAAPAAGRGEEGRAAGAARRARIVVAPAPRVRVLGD